MVEYCPKCGAQLPPGLEKCPGCGHRLRRKRRDDYTLRDIARLTCFTLLIVLVPVLSGVGLIWLIISHLK